MRPPGPEGAHGPVTLTASRRPSSLFIGRINKASFSPRALVTTHTPGLLEPARASRVRGQGGDVLAEPDDGLLVTAWRVPCSLTDHLDVGEEGVWPLGPQPDVLDVQGQQEGGGGCGEDTGPSGRHLLGQTARHPPSRDGHAMNRAHSCGH